LIIASQPRGMQHPGESYHGIRDKLKNGLYRKHKKEPHVSIFDGVNDQFHRRAAGLADTV